MIFVVFLITICIWLIFYNQEERKFTFNKTRKRSLILFILSLFVMFVGLRGGGPIFTTLGSFLAIFATVFSRIVVLLPNILLALRIFPFFKNKSFNEGNSKKMTIEEAREILGVNAHSTKEEIHIAFKKAMLRNHPDHGGSNYLAAQINEAKKILLYNS